MSAAKQGRRPRILVLATTVPAREDDGTPAFVLTLAQALASANDVSILTPRVPDSASRERLGGVEIVRFGYFPRRFEGLAAGAIMPNLAAEPWRLVEVPFLLVAFLAAAVREARKARPDLVHAHWLLPAGAVALALRRSFGIPYIATAHAADVFRFRVPPFRGLKRAIIDRAATVSAVSIDTATVLGLPPDRVEELVVPMGVDVDRIQAAVGKRAPEAGRFLFVGRLVEKKGVDVLLRALAQVPDASAVVVGDGPERKGLEALAQELALDSRVTFVGRQGQSEIARQLRLAQALVVPSRVASDGDADGTPVVMAEGMAAGVPVIGSRLGGISEHVVSGESGLLVRPDDPDELAGALRRTLAAPDEAAGWAERALEAAREGLDIAVIADRYQAFIDAALDRQGRQLTSSPPRTR